MHVDLVLVGDSAARRQIAVGLVRYILVLVIFLTGILAAGLIYACVVFQAVTKGVMLPMSTRTATH